MLKVIIVEDEDVVRDDIKQLIDWEKHGFVITAEARNGSEGLRMVLEHNPDIVITDIKMPVMGGLEMINQISKIKKSKKFILLSAYGDFNFARKAIKLGIRSYLLKHELDSELLVKELYRVKSEIDEEIRIDYLSRTEILRRYVGRGESRMESEGTINMENLFRWKGSTGLFVMGFDQIVPDAKDELDKNEFIDFVYRKVFAEREAELANLNEQDYVVFFRYPQRYSEREKYEYTFAFARDLQDFISKQFHQTVSVAIGPMFNNYYDLWQCLQETKKLFSLRVFHKGNTLLEDTQHLPDYDSLQTAIREKMDEIREHLYLEQYDQAKGSLDDLFIRLLTSLLDEDILRNCIVKLVRLIDRISVSKPHTINVLETLRAIEQLDNVFQISIYFRALVDNLEDSEPKHSKKIEGLLKFIHDNYQRDITLTEIADQLGVSLIYSSQLFKKEVGVSFIAYVTHYRIEKAKELIESGQYKIYEVSSMVGYQTVQYFSKIFKKITGKNPSDFSN
jgi:two-component system response regulator YesN